MNLFIDIYNSIKLISNLLLENILNIFIRSIKPELNDIDLTEDINKLKFD